jgi:hypothetical protein
LDRAQDAEAAEKSFSLAGCGKNYLAFVVVFVEHQPIMQGPMQPDCPSGPGPRSYV